jgi:hypothetical protein
MKGTTMRLRAGLGLRLGLAACCCAALAACTAGAPKGPNTTVSTPSVGRPPPPVSAQAALSGEAFTPYAALGISTNDGLAPGESQYTLVGPCMNAAGYPGVTVSDFMGPLSISIGGGLAFTQPWGGWGYLGAADAQQYGFRVPPGAALTALGLGGTPSASPPSVPAAEQAAAGKCGTIIQDFSNAAQRGALAGIATLGNDITNDVQHDAAVKAATRAWSACMAKNGYTFGQPQAVWGQELQDMYGGQRSISPSTQVSASAQQAQLAAAVTDADCTQSSDLAGIYFAVQASYEQQLVNANQQALAAAVKQYRAAYAKEVAKLPALLRTAKAQPFGQPAVKSTGKPTPCAC